MSETMKQLTPEAMFRQIAARGVYTNIPLDQIEPEDLEIILDCVKKISEKEKAPADEGGNKRS